MMQQESDLKRVGHGGIFEFCVKDWGKGVIGNLSNISIIYGVNGILLFFWDGFHVTERTVRRASRLSVGQSCTVPSLISRFSTIEVEVLAYAMLLFLGHEMSAVCGTSSSVSFLSFLSSSLEDINFCYSIGFFSLEFLDLRAATWSIYIRTGIYVPIASVLRSSLV